MENPSNKEKREGLKISKPYFQMVFIVLLCFVPLAYVKFYTITQPFSVIKVYAVSGTVRCEETEEPLGGVTVSLDPSSTPMLTRSDGSYTIFTKPGTHLLTFFLEGYETCEEKMDVQDNLTVDVVLKLPSTDPNGNGCEPTLIIGIVTDAKTQLPIERALVNTTREQDRTVEDGSYILNIQVGSYVVTASKEGYKKESATIDVLEEEQSYRLDFVLTPVPTITLTAPANLYVKVSRVLMLTATVKKADGTPANEIMVSFNYLGDIIRLDPDWPKGEFEALTAVTNCLGHATVTWTCLEDFSRCCFSIIIFTAQTMVEGHSIECEVFVNAAHEPCEVCH